MSTNTVTVQVANGPTMTAPWTSGMNVQQAMEAAFDAQNPSGEFTYSIQYFGSEYGYLVVMINETYESFPSSPAAEPFYFWELLVNGTAAPTGIDSTILNNGDTVTFDLQFYLAERHARSTLRAKYQSRTRGRR